MDLASRADQIYTPVILDLKKDSDNDFFLKLIEAHSRDIVLDHYPSQRKELFKIDFPGRKLTENDLDQLYDSWKEGIDVSLEGVWVYYPWSHRLIHTLTREEFIRLRTSRNQYKISSAEQKELMARTIGIIGLSVGSAVAFTLATERTCGKLKLADFDTIELSNLNRIKTGIHNLGLNKCIVTAREIAEIDPFIEIECYTEGITEENLSTFLTGSAILDILIDECDDIGMKIKCRMAARELGIPVVMETSDRGMLDVERFDREKTRPLFHGLLEGIPEERLLNISPADRLPLVMKIVDVMKSSPRARMSLLEIGQSITTWPQLASAVTLGGAVVTDTCRRILLGSFVESGRFYVDLDQVVNIPNVQHDLENVRPNDTFDIKRAFRITDSLLEATDAVHVTKDQIFSIVSAASLAPSKGNRQPWKWIYNNKALHLFNDLSENNTPASLTKRTNELALGASIENALLRAAQLGIPVELVFSPIGQASDLVASLRFVSPGAQQAYNHPMHELAGFILSRHTNRSPGTKEAIPREQLDLLAASIQGIPGADVCFINNPIQVHALADVLAESNLISILTDNGHNDFFEKDLHWPGTSGPDRENRGISMELLHASPTLLTTLSMLKDKKVALALRNIGGGKMVSSAYAESLSNASSFALICLPRDIANKYLLGGMAAERFWLTAEKLGYGIQPVDSLFQLASQLADDGSLSEGEIEKIRHLKEVFRSIANLGENFEEIFLCKIVKANTPTVRTKRLPLTEILFMPNNEI